MRDLRVRWALEEAGLPYDAKTPRPGRTEFRGLPRAAAVRPGSVFEQDGLTLFESGAIVMHVAEKSGTLLPQSADVAPAR